MTEKNDIKVPPAVILAGSMDSPSVPWTVGDLFKVNNKVFMTYHCMFAGYDLLTPLGCMIGGLALPRISSYSHLSSLQAAGTGGYVAGGAGLGLGLIMLVKTATSKEPKLPWDEGGIQNRVDGLSHNYRVRAMDLGTWAGIAAAGGALLYAGGPQKLGLAAGTFGHLQAIAIGSALGSVGANLIVTATK